MSNLIDFKKYKDKRDAEPKEKPPGFITEEEAAKKKKKLQEEARKHNQRVLKELKGAKK